MSLHLTEEEFKGYSKLTAGFERYFVPCRNVIHERVRFSQRRQMDHEAASSPSQEQHRVRQDTQEEYQYLFYPPSEPNWSEWRNSALLSVVDGLLLRGRRLVIPPVLRDEVLPNLHTGHEGITRCRTGPRKTAWWPCMSEHLRDFIRRCPTCQVHREPDTEPLLQTPLPEQP